MLDRNTANRRLISGDRVKCKCALKLPKVDVFNNVKANHQGIMVLNTRGCALYLPNQFTELSIGKIFIKGKPGLVKDIILFPKESTEIRLGNINARFLRFTGCVPEVGMVLRFVNLSEEQLCAINQLIEQLPPAGAADNPDDGDFF